MIHHIHLDIALKTFKRADNSPIGIHSKKRAQKIVIEHASALERLALKKPSSRVAPILLERARLLRDTVQE